MKIIKVGFYSAAATFAKLLTSLFIIKAVAWYAGPEGVGRMGQFLSLMSLVVVFSCGGIASGIIKYVSEYMNDKAKQQELIQAATGYTLFATALLTLIIVCFSLPLTVMLLGDESFRHVLLLLALLQPLIALHSLVLAIVNGFMEIRLVAIINISGSFVGLVSTAALTYFFKLEGALYALVISQAILIFVSYPLLKRTKFFQRNFLKPKINLVLFRSLAAYSLMALTSAALAPLVQIAVRNHLAAKFSWEQAGYWQAVSKVSDAYLLTITTAISVYYLPRLSSIIDTGELVAELKKAFSYLMPFVVVASFFVYLFREPITLILFSKNFLPGLELYAPQLAGDVVKIASFILSYLMLAKAMTKLFIASEIFFSLTYLAWVWLLTFEFGLIGVMYAFFINYIMYLAFNIFVVKKYIKKSAIITA